MKIIYEDEEIFFILFYFIFNFFVCIEIVNFNFLRMTNFLCRKNIINIIKV